MTSTLLQHLNLAATVTPELDAERLDRALSALFPEYSRTKIQQWIKAGDVAIDGNVVIEQRTKVFSEQKITINVVLQPHDAAAKPQDIALDIVYEDDALLVINKPVGLVVHPGSGVTDNTLMNALLHHDPGLANIPRAGIVHRLDKDTSGLLVVARTLAAHTKLVTALAQRQVKREYIAVIHGVLLAGGTVTAPIGRHLVQRTHMAVRTNGKVAITHYRVLEKFHAHTFVSVRLETGRTHQIRVHMAHIGHPIVGDQTYAGRLKIPRNATPELAEYLRNFKRQALHARCLGLIHPVSGELLEVTAPIPDDIEQLLKLLRDADCEFYEKSRKK